MPTTKKCDCVLLNALREKKGLSYISVPLPPKQRVQLIQVHSYSRNSVHSWWELMVCDEPSRHLPAKS